MARDQDLDLLKAIRLLAWDSVKNRPSEYLMRHIFRWYSERFHTPLHEVDDLPLEDVLQHYFEVRYEELPDELSDDEEEHLRETREERLAREANEAAEKEDDDAFFRQVQAEAAAQRAKAPKLDEKLQPAERPLMIAAPTMGEVLPTHFAEVAQGAEPKIKEVPPEINMQFVDENAFDNIDDWDVTGPVTLPKK